MIRPVGRGLSQVIDRAPGIKGVEHIVNYQFQCHHRRPYGASVPEENRAASLGEFGGVGLFVRDHMWPVANNAYDYEPTTTRLTDRYVFLLDEVEQLMKYKGLSVAIYTQTTDVEHEVNGILTYDRAIEKMEMDRVK